MLVNFWTYTCVNCLRELPHVKAWYDAYRRDGFVVVGVHAPEFAFEHESDNVRRAIRDLDIRHPVLLDNDFGTWNAYANQYWPANYLVDRNGHVRYVHFGEGSTTETENAIRALLADPALPRVQSARADRTPLAGGRRPRRTWAGSGSPRRMRGRRSKKSRWRGTRFRPRCS